MASGQPLPLGQALPPPMDDAYACACASPKARHMALEVGAADDLVLQAQRSQRGPSELQGLVPPAACPRWPAALLCPTPSSDEDRMALATTHRMALDTQAGVDSGYRMAAAAHSGALRHTRDAAVASQVDAAQVDELASVASPAPASVDELAATEPRRSLEAASTAAQSHPLAYGCPSSCMGR
jgi:hypothetical protein